MVKTNVKTRLQEEKTHEGAPAKRIGAEMKLRRSVMSCMLWEDEFYESGISISKRIEDLVPTVKPEIVAQIAIDARNKMKLRHAPLWVIKAMAKSDPHKRYVADTLFEVIQRPDELTEFLALYWMETFSQVSSCWNESKVRLNKKIVRTPISAQVKKGLARAFTKFDAYQLAKWDREGDIKLKDVLFLVHAKPKDKEQAELWKKLVERTLSPANTWEYNMSKIAGKKTEMDKKDVWTEQLQKNTLGSMALLKNLRNMQQAGVSNTLIKQGIEKMSTRMVLPFRFITAAKFAPTMEDELQQAMFRSVSKRRRLTGTTVFLIDVSGSMRETVSGKSEATREDAANGIAMIGREMVDDAIIYSFSSDCVQVPSRHGFALRDAIHDSQHHRNTNLGEALRQINKLRYDRLIVITDEQSHDRVGDPSGRGYIINVASAKNGVGYGKWIHVDGFSEATLDYIAELESDFDEVE